MMKTALFFSLFILGIASSHAQDSESWYKKIVPPSPNAAAFDKYGEVPVSYYTGVPTIDIPIHTISNKEISLSVSLSYHAGGIRVDEEASRVGLGWALNAGGVINRSVNGIDDFIPQFGYLAHGSPEVFSDQATEYLKRAPLLVSGRNGGAPEEDCDRIIGGQTYDLSAYLSDMQSPERFQYDLEPDTYSFNFFGYTGKFALDKSKQAVKQAPDALDIKLLSADGSRWQITTPDGIKFLFEKTEVCTLRTGTNTDPYEPTFISSWYLTKVVSPTGAEVTLHYSDHATPIATLYTIYEKNTRYTKLLNGNASCSPIGPTYSNPPLRSYNLVLLDSISYPYGSVAFEYLDRIDLQGDKRISNIRVNNHRNQAFNTTFELLNNQYFTADYGQYTDYLLSPLPTGATTNADYYHKRLKLAGVLQKDAAGSPGKKHYFTYKETNLPPKNSTARDHWGFFNGASGNQTLVPRINFLHPFSSNVQVITFQGADREPDTLLSQAFMLTEIQYPTGGSTKLEYEQNDFDIGNSINPMARENHPEYEKGSQSFITRRISEGAKDETFSLRVPATLSGTNVTLSSISRNGEPGTVTSYPEDAYIEIYAMEASTPLVYIPLGVKDAWSTRDESSYGYTYSRVDPLNLPPGEYIVKTHVADNVLFLNYLEFTFQYVSPNLNVQTNHGIRLGGGVRIARTTNIDPVTNTENMQRYIYHYEEDRDLDGTPEKYSHGRRMSQLMYTNHELTYSCQNDEAIYCDSFTLLSGSHIQGAGPIVGYDQVTVLKGENGEGGKTEFQYENVPDHELRYDSEMFHLMVVNHRPAGVQDLMNFQNGLLKRKIDFKYIKESGNFEKVKEVTNTYVSSPASTLMGIRKLLKVFSGNPCKVSSCAWIIAQYPAFQSSWTRLASETVVEYDKGLSSYVASNTAYSYEAGTPRHYQPVLVSSKSSKGKTIATSVAYPTDYLAGTAFLDDMVASHILRPIERVSYQIDNTTADIHILSGQVTTYQQGGRGLIDTEYQLDVPTPIAQSAYKFSNRSMGELSASGTATAFALDTRYEDRVTFQYDNMSSNLVAVVPKGDFTTSYLWGYSETKPIAQAINATPESVFHTSFEDNGAESTNAKTGMRYHSGSYTFSPPAGFTPVSGSTLSYWSWSNTVGEWSLVEQAYSGGSVTCTGDRVDELRITPPGAQMTTYTYDPLVGMTSATDASGRTTYYEYDGFNRLKAVKDHEGNVVQGHEYLYAGQ